MRSVKAPGRYGDGNGLYLVVDPSGARRWLLRIVIHGKRCDLGLGSARLVSLVDAREEARRLRKVAREGGDPRVERHRARRIVLTFKEAAKEVHAAHSTAFRNAKHRAQWLASLEADVFPVFGDRPVNAIESGDVLKALAAIWTTKPETARRLKQRIKVVLDWAKVKGFREGENPVDGVTRGLPRVRPAVTHHAALPYVQIPAFLETLREASTGEPTRLAFEFLILTATRTSEVLGARWEEIDRDAETWTIPGKRIKAGRALRVPLSPRCGELLDRAKAIANGGPFVFPSRSPEKPLSNMVFLMLLRRLNREDLTAHGFRSAFRDWSAERTNFPRAVCEAALAHVVRDKAEAAYLRSDLFDLRRSLMDTWAAFATAKTASVVPIRA